MLLALGQPLRHLDGVLLVEEWTLDHGATKNVTLLL